MSLLPRPSVSPIPPIASKFGSWSSHQHGSLSFDEPIEELGRASGTEANPGTCYVESTPIVHKSKTGRLSALSFVSKSSRRQSTQAQNEPRAPTFDPALDLPPALRRVLEAVESMSTGHSELSEQLRERWQQEFPLVRSLASLWSDQVRAQCCLLFTATALADSSRDSGLVSQCILQLRHWPRGLLGSDNICS